MSDNIMLMIGDDGKATMYDDTYDITIHCESKEEQDEVRRLLKIVSPERKTGRWLLRSYMPHKNYCSNCGKDSPYDTRWDYCPNCGTDMRGKVE